MKTIFLIIAIVLFVIATIIALGNGNIDHAAALIPAGLAFFAAFFLPTPLV